jgi:ABC-type transporter Mla subunit MlaD
MYIIIFQKINSYYYRILDAFYEILKGFNNNSKTEIIYNLDKQSDVIGNSRNQINELITKYNDVLKNFQPEKEKYILI